MHERVVQQAMQLWFEPEIQRRQQAGLLEVPFSLRAAQVIMFADERPYVIRLNEEVQIAGKARLKNVQGLTKGDIISGDQIDEIQGWMLPETEDPNCGHLTIVIFRGRVYISFDFRYNKALSSELLSAADEFLKTAGDSLSRGDLRVAVDTLFSAAELAAKAFIVSTPFPGKRPKRQHKFIQTQVNVQGKLGNIDDEFRGTFNRLFNMRRAARYLEEGLSVEPSELEAMEKTVKSFIGNTRPRIS